MAHLNTVRFPDGLAVGVVYGPEFVTEVVALSSGAEKRNRVRRNALCVGDCAHAPKNEADYDVLLKFFRGMNGRLNTFRFKDYSDYRCAATEGVVVGLTARTFQLSKLYFLATGFEEVRTIQAPIDGGFVLYNSGTPLTLTTDYTLNTATGIVTTVADRVAANLSWSGQFDNVVRFDTDRMATSIDNHKIFTWGGIPIKEQRL